MGHAIASLHQPWALAVALAATDSTKTLKTAPSAGSTIVVEKLTVSVTTAAAQAMSVQDSASTPVAIAKVPASATGQWTFEFGDYGFPLTKGKNLAIVPAAAGPAAWVTAFGYFDLDTSIQKADTAA